MRISVIGAGYVGLVSGACLAQLGHRVVVVDNNADRVNNIRNGKAPFYEPGLTELLQKLDRDFLTATENFHEAVENSELTLIAVGTPSLADGSVDLMAIETVARQVGEVIATKIDRHTVIVKSTVPPGTTEGIVGRAIEQVSGKSRGKDFGLGMNPEFLTEGTAVNDFMYPDRLVLGGSDPETITAQRAIYADFKNIPTLETNNSTAEMIKYMSNALLATMISFANEFSDLCESIGGIDVTQVQQGVHLSRYLTTVSDSRVDTAPIASFIEAGCGFGGSCLPKDTKGLVAIGEERRVSMRLMRAVLDINAARPDRIMAILKSKLDSLQGTRIAVLGLSFRPDTSDIRESPSFPVIRRLLESGAAVTAYDPQAMEETKAELGDLNISYASSMADCIDAAEAIIVLTSWSEFKELAGLVSGRKDNPLVIDGRRFLTPSDFGNYAGIGFPGEPS